MSDNSAIEWTEATWNPLAGCTPVSPGCLNCYAAKMAYRLEKMGQEKYRGLTVLHNGRRTFNGIIQYDDAMLVQPLAWSKPRRVFVNSMSDLFHELAPTEHIDRVFAVMAMTPQHTYQVLTKRPQNMARYFADPDVHGRVVQAITDLSGDCGSHQAARDVLWMRRPLPNVWLGASMEDAAAWKARYLHLTRCPAAVRFISAEPLLGPIPMLPELLTERMIHWVIVGGESGPKARPCNVEWIRFAVTQCVAAGVPVFVKQLGARVVTRCVKNEDGWPGGTAILRCLADEERVVLLKNRKGGDPAQWPEDLRIRQYPTSQADRDKGVWYA